MNSPIAKESGAFQESAKIPKLRLSARQISDIELLGNGGYSPLQGFLGHADYKSVLETMRLADGTPWSIPVTLPVNEETVQKVKSYPEVGLEDPQGNLLAVLHLEEWYRTDKNQEAQKVYGTTDSKHPGVASLLAQGEFNLAGKVNVLQLPHHSEFSSANYCEVSEVSGSSLTGHERTSKPTPKASYHLTPEQTKQIFRERGWRTIVGFQTRNPIHRAHEYLIKCALEIVDGLLLHPLVGETKSDDIPAYVRMRCYEALVKHYFPANQVVLSVNPASMRYAGPREAVFHSIIRRNYGCTHMIIGRDHAGVGNYYGTYDAHKIFSQYRPGELGITPLFFDHAFFCTKCQGMASRKTCPHSKEDHLQLSGTQVREKLAAGQTLPPEFSRPEVAKILMESFQAQSRAKNGKKPS